jgi:hypothetical protein
MKSQPLGAGSPRSNSVVGTREGGRHSAEGVESSPQKGISWKGGHGVKGRLHVETKAKSLAPGERNGRPSGSPVASANRAYNGIPDEPTGGSRDASSLPVVHFEDRQRYVDAVLRLRLRECKRQVDAIRRGLQCILPIKALSLFTSTELQQLVVGVAEVDIGYLRKHTRYEGYRRSDTAVARFWRVMESFSQEQRCAFVRFAYGRSRLPRGNEIWTDHLLLSRVGDVTRFPVAHTCFFKVDLPPYETEAEMRDKLLTAIASGSATVSMLLA